MEEAKKRVILSEFHVENTADSDFPGTYGAGDCDAWSHEKFKSKFRVKIIKMTNLDMEFDLIGINAAIANSLRRILLSEVPSMAIEKVYVTNNTSVIKDEVLAHRLGLIPLKANPNLFEYKSDKTAEPNEQDTLEYELKIKCIVNCQGIKNSHQLDDMYKNHNVYSRHIKWVPIGGQSGIYKEKDVRPVNGDILINKLRPGQELDLKLLAMKGIGKDHAKFSPVATASYRLLPEIELVKEVKGEAAERLQQCFSPGVIGVKDVDGVPTAVVLNARYDSASRNVFRHDDLKDCVVMKRVRDHFIFSIESVGAMPPDVLFLETIKILKGKCRKYLEEIGLATSKSK